MTLPSSGTLTTAQVSQEFYGNTTTVLDLTGSDVRDLIGKPSGTITFPDDFYGKSGSSSAAIPVRGYGWSIGSPAPVATKRGSTVTLSGIFVASGIAGSGEQQNAGTLPVGYRPSSDLSFGVYVGNTQTTLYIATTGILQVSTSNTALNGNLNLSGISFSV